LRRIFSRPPGGETKGREKIRLKNKKQRRTKMKNFKTYQLAMEFHRLAKDHSLKGNYKDQFNRALLSIPLNLAEGAGKQTMRDKRRFYFIALGSFREIECMIELFEMNTIKKQADILGAHLVKLCHAS